LISAGIFTSLWNHGGTFRIATLCDRLVMMIGLPIDVYLSINIPNPSDPSVVLWISKRYLCISGIFVATALYFTTKLLTKESFLAPSTGKGRKPSSNSIYENLKYIPHFSSHACLTFVHCCLLMFYSNKID
jgi:hypothetical protein